jgi:hypothetical protein
VFFQKKKKSIKKEKAQKREIRVPCPEGIATGTRPCIVEKLEPEWILSMAHD